MTTDSLITSSIIGDDILKTAANHITELARTEILQCMTQLMKKKECFFIIRHRAQTLCIEKNSLARNVEHAVCGFISIGHVKG